MLYCKSDKDKGEDLMRKKLFLAGILCTCGMLLTACSNTEDTDESDNSSIVDTEAATEENAVEFSETVGVWTYSKDIVFHSRNGNRYLLKEDPVGSVQDTEGKSYSVQECDYRLYTIMTFDKENMTVREGRYAEAYLNHPDYPDGYKTMIINYEKSDLFAADKLEEAIGNPDSAAKTEETNSETEEAESITETEPETTESAVPEEIQQTETESSASAENTENPDEAEYAEIYQKIEDFLETDNFKQKDPANGALELFNYLHNLADEHIEENSITNDSDQNQISFRCYEKYTIIINVADSTITVTES